MKDTPKRAVTVDEKDSAVPAGASNSNRAPAWIGFVFPVKGYESELVKGVMVIVFGDEAEVD